jgi:DNA-binding IscR family transcriptional regulator
MMRISMVRHELLSRGEGYMIPYGRKPRSRTKMKQASTQRALVLTIKAIGSGRPSLVELEEVTGLKERYLRYMITLLRARGIVKGERGRVYRYGLTADAHAQHVKISLIKAIENVASNDADED